MPGVDDLTILSMGGGGGGGASAAAWASVMAGAYGDGNPYPLLYGMENLWEANASPTPTQITTTIARCSPFILDEDLVVNKLRFFGVGNTTDIYHVALYRLSDLARLTADLNFSTVATTWGSVGTALAVQLTAGVPYFLACSVDSTGTTAGVTAFTRTLNSVPMSASVIPTSWPGSLDLDGGIVAAGFFQFTVTAGALPDPAAALALPASWTNGMPAFFLDSNNA